MISIAKNLENHLDLILPNHEFSEVLRYAVLPAGKLFRPKLVMALANDLKCSTKNHEYFASSVEIHHAYTLIHDDLPAMDDDDFRRGKAATHKKFNEWKAILAGDALLAASFQLLSYIDHSSLRELISLYGEMTGARGLILGQVLDLEEQKKNLDQILEIHTLKTSRLMQLALQGANILSNSPLKAEEVLNFGNALGIVFQLLDDLIELSDKTIGKHEMEINPFLKFDQKNIITILADNISTLHNFYCSHNLLELKALMDSYFSLTREKIMKDEEQIKKHLGPIDGLYTLF